MSPRLLSPSGEDYEGILVGIGCPLLDLTAKVNKEFLRKYNIELDGFIHADKKHSSLNAELEKEFHVEFTPGGPTQNTIMTAQWMLEIPDATTYLGSIGKDAYGEEIKKKLKSAGVKARFHEFDTPGTGTSALCMIGHKRSVVCNLGAGYNYTSENLIRPQSWALVENAKYIYIAGFFLMVSPESIQHVAEHAAENDKIFAMNLSETKIPEFYNEELQKALPYTDYLFANEAQAKTFARVLGWETEQVEDIALKISSLPKASGTYSRITVITQAEGPVIVAKDGKVKSTPVRKVPDEKIVDVGAAGDAFVGGFLSQLVQEKSLEECVRGGIYTSSLVIQRWGCSFPDKPDFK